MGEGTLYHKNGWKNRTEQKIYLLNFSLHHSTLCCCLKTWIIRGNEQHQNRVAENANESIWYETKMDYEW